MPFVYYLTKHLQIQQTGIGFQCKIRLPAEVAPDWCTSVLEVIPDWCASVQKWVKFSILMQIDTYLHIQFFFRMNPLPVCCITQAGSQSSVHKVLIVCAYALKWDAQQPHYAEGKYIATIQLHYPNIAAHLFCINKSSSSLRSRCYSVADAIVLTHFLIPGMVVRQ